MCERDGKRGSDREGGKGYRLKNAKKIYMDVKIWTLKNIRMLHFKLSYYKPLKL